MPFETQIKTTPKVKQFRLVFNIPFTKKTIRFTTMVYRSPDTWSRGISNRCKDSRYVQFFDFDNHDLIEVVDEIKYLQAQHKLSHAYIFENDIGKSYHVIMLDKFSFLKTYDVLRDSSTEWAYLNSARLTRGKEWVLRTYSKGERIKPKFLKIIKSKYNLHQISTAHKQYIENKNPEVPKLKYNYEDGIDVLAEISYNTGNRVDFKDARVD